MNLEVPAELQLPVNHAVLDYLQDKSAHSDIADVLVGAVKSLGDARVYCPDWHAYRYVAAYTRGIIFGVALGMDTVGFRLDDRMRDRALATGGVDLPECGPGWVAVLHHAGDSDWPAVDVKFWALKACQYARLG